MIDHRWLSCADFDGFPDKPDCCSSCHYEWDDGYGEPVEKRCDEHPNVSAMVCCAVGEWLCGVTPDHWAAAIRAHGARIDLPPDDRCVKILGSPECGVDMSKFAPGDPEAECDKTYDCCRLRFDNGVRFGGSPKVPKRDDPEEKPTG